MVWARMISIVIPTLNAAPHLPHSLRALFDGAVEGLVKELIVVDGGSDDNTIAICQAAGAEIITGHTGRGPQLRAGGEAAKAQWLLFLHADTVLSDGWVDEVRDFISNQPKTNVGIFTFALDDKRLRARILEFIVKLRCKLLSLPYGDQGLLISRELYDELGGFKPLVLMEDVDIVSRLGRARITYLKTKATTSAQRYQKSGYMKRMARNAYCLSLWFAGVKPEEILKRYQ